MKRPGLTFLEVMVSVTIMAIVVLVVTTIFISTAKYNSQEQSQVVVGDAATRIFSSVDGVLRQGQSIATNTTISGTTYTTGDTTLVLLLPSIVNGTPSTTVTDTAVLTYDSSTQTVQYFLSADATSSRVSGTATVMTNVSGLYFRYTTDDPTQSTALSMIATVANTAQGRTNTQTSILYATLRNHS